MITSPATALSKIIQFDTTEKRCSVCKKIYVPDEHGDDGVCSFDCWEQKNCHSSGEVTKIASATM
jgi:hypothetical protein